MNGGQIIRAPEPDQGGGFHTIVSRRLDPAAAEIVERPCGMSIGEIVETDFPGATPEQRSRLVIVLVFENRERELSLDVFAEYRPPAGSTVRFHVRIESGAITRTLLTAVIIAFAAWAGPALLGAGILGTLATAAIAYAGVQLLNALIPIEPPKTGERPDPRYKVEGSRNAMVPYGKIPENFGTNRIYPPHAAQPWTEGVRDQRYTRFLFLLGYTGPEYDNWQIGPTALEEYKDYELEIYTIRPDEPWPVLGYTNPVFELAEDILLKQANGWEVRDAPHNTDLLSTEFVCKNGLCRYKKKGNDRPRTIQVAIEYKEKGAPATDWVPVKVLTATEETQQEFWFSHTWLAPKVANWQVRTRRVTADTDSTKVVDRVHWAILRGVRPIRPIKFNKAIDVAYLRIRGYEQATGMLDQISCLAHAVLPDWDVLTQSWVTRRTSSPAAAMRRIAEGPANPNPTPIEEVDLAAHAALAAHAQEKGMTFNMAMDQDISVDEALRMAARAGRAFPTRPEGMRSLFIDRPQTVKRGVISARNASNLSGEPAYADPIDAFRVSFLDETDSFRQTERLVPSPWLVGPAKTFMALDLPGFTNPTMIWRECIRRHAELRLRFETLYAEQGLRALQAPPGGLLGAQFLTVAQRQMSARVINAADNLVVLDEEVEIVDGEAYACQFESANGEVYVRSVAGSPGFTRLLRLLDTGQKPKIGEVALFGIAGHEAEDVIVKAVEPLKDERGRLTLVAHAPEIEALAMQAVPEWFPIVPEPRPWADEAPAKPVIEKVTSGGPRVDPVDEDPDEDDEVPGDPPPVVAIVRAGTDSPAPTDRIVVTAKKGSKEEVQEVTAGYGSAKFTTFEVDDHLTLTAIAYSLFDIPSPQSDPVTHTVQETIDIAPVVESFSAFRQTTGKIFYAWATDNVLTQAQIRYGAPTAPDFPSMTAAHSGYLTSSPYEGALPSATGAYKVGVTVLDTDTDLVSAPFYAKLGISPEADAAIARMTVAPSNVRTNLLRYLIGRLVTAGVWAKLDALYLLAAHDAQAAKLNLKQNAFNAVANGTLTLTVDQGLTSDGTSGYLDTGFNPSTAGGQYLQDDAHMFVYSRTNPAVVGTQYDIGAVPAANRAAICLKNASGNLVTYGNITTALSSAIDALAPVDAAWSRLTSVGYSRYLRGSLITGSSQASTARPAANLFIGARNTGTAAADFTPRQISAASFGAGLTTPQVAELRAAVHEYLQAIGAVA